MINAGEVIGRQQPGSVPPDFYGDKPEAYRKRSSYHQQRKKRKEDNRFFIHFVTALAIVGS
jgi:hypothetical protein